MNKREAKKIVYSYLVYMLDPVNYGEYLRVEAEDNDEDHNRLLEAVEKVLQELERRAEVKR